eukprot:m.302885 g.302885  ORF g.302885 m.302885 type:complete len:69 (+) comp15890_c0_seq11:2833-3039(+)
MRKHVRIQMGRPQQASTEQPPCSHKQSTYKLDAIHMCSDLAMLSQIEYMHILVDTVLRSQQRMGFQSG